MVAYTLRTFLFLAKPVYVCDDMGASYIETRHNACEPLTLWKQLPPELRFLAEDHVVC